MKSFAQFLGTLVIAAVVFVLWILVIDHVHTSEIAKYIYLFVGFASVIYTTTIIFRLLKKA